MAMKSKGRELLMKEILPNLRNQIPVAVKMQVLVLLH